MKHIILSFILCIGAKERRQKSLLLNYTFLDKFNCFKNPDQILFYQTWLKPTTADYFGNQLTIGGGCGTPCSLFISLAVFPSLHFVTEK